MPAHTSGMPHPARIRRRLIFTATSLAAIALAFALDRAALGWCSERLEHFKILARLISKMADWPTLALISLLGFLLTRAFRWKKTATLLALMLAATALAGLLVNPLRALTGRVRPNAKEAKGWKGPWEESRWVAGRHSRSAFPSAHTAVIAAFVAPLVFGRRSRWLTASVAIGGVAWSRMYLGVHHLSDVTAGASVGLLSGWAVVQSGIARAQAAQFAAWLCRPAPAAAESARLESPAA